MHPPGQRDIRRFRGDFDHLDSRIAPERDQRFDRLVDIRLDRLGGRLKADPRAGAPAPFDKAFQGQFVQGAARSDPRHREPFAQFMLGRQDCAERLLAGQYLVAQRQIDLVIEGNGIVPVDRHAVLSPLAVRVPL